MNNEMKVFVYILLIFCGLALIPGIAVAGAQKEAPDASGSNLSCTAALGSFYQFETDLDDGGGFSLFSFSTRTGLNREIGPSTTVGLSFDYGCAVYDFSGITSFGGPDPWSDIHAAGIGVHLSRNFGERWRLFLGPTFQFSGEAGSQWTDALTCGGMLSLLHTVNSNFSIGFGTGLFQDIEEVKVFPVILIRWNINEKLTLTNPLPAGPAGAGGLELVYTCSDRLRFGSGAAYRSSRFRLDGSGFAPDGIGETESGMFWCRLSRPLGRKADISVHIGIPFAGKLSIEDRDGNKLGSNHYHSTPFAALTVVSRF